MHIINIQRSEKDLCRLHFLASEGENISSTTTSVEYEKEEIVTNLPISARIYSFLLRDVTDFTVLTRFRCSRIFRALFKDCGGRL